ncbi:MAG: hypothetical protein ABMA15_14645 [Vicinamibacterales bacterium]
MKRVALGALLLVASLSVAACGDSTTTSPTTTTATPTTELFSGTLSPKGSSFYSFTASTTGAVSVTLASTTTAKVGPAIAAKLTIGLGVPSGFGCAVTSSIDATPGLSAQLSNSSLTADSNGSIYCIRVSDPGQLTSDVLFVIRIVHT